MPRVSVIIPAYNAAAYVQEALNSVLRQTYSDWEVLLVDDGSTDNTHAIAAAAAPDFCGKLKYIYQTNLGLPAARNTGIRHAAGEFVALLDADDVWLSPRLARGVEMMEKHPGAGLVHAKVARIDERGEIIEKPVAPPAKYLSGKIAHHIYARRAHLLCPTILFRKKCVDRVGGFDEVMRATEDRDLWFRIAEHYDTVYVDEILAYYRISPSSMSRDWNRMMTWQIYFIDKHHKRGACGIWARHQAFGNLFRERGDALFNKGELRVSLRWYFSSFRHYPFSFTNTYMLFRAMAEPLLAKMRPAPTTISRSTSL